MAKADVMAESLFALEDASLHFQMLLDVVLEVSDTECPKWAVVVQRAFGPVAEHLESLGKHVRQTALPYLRDLDAVNGGLGAVAPKGTKVVDGELTTSRK